MTAQGRASKLTRSVARIVALIMLLGSIAACVPAARSPYSNPSTGQVFAGDGTRLERRTVGPAPFLHVVFSKANCSQADGVATFVFLDGDGDSWIRGGRVSEDPTPAEPIALDLMVHEPSCGLYVSRPCTFGLAAQDSLCEPAVWTLDRYSAAVVDSLTYSIDHLLPPDRPIVLVGWSGGGLIASHIANRIPRVEAIVTLGANLDLEGWVDLHGYTRRLLERSLPTPFPLRKGLIAVHVLGSADDVSPPSLTLALLGEHADETMILEGADHRCCWVREWPRIRKVVQQRRERSARIRSSSSAR
ncbi:MAG: hypothetical protein PVI01_15480 [Gemmatimonadales bacterium]